MLYDQGLSVGAGGPFSFSDLFVFCHVGKMMKHMDPVLLIPGILFHSSLISFFSSGKLLISMFFASVTVRKEDT